VTPIIYFEDVSIGDVMPSLLKDPIEKLQLIKYAGASGDFNPLHTDPNIGKSIGMGGCIAHGMLIMGFVGEAITSWISKKYLRTFTLRFVGMTKPGDSICIVGHIVEKNETNKLIMCKVTAKKQTNEVVAEGFFEARLPSKLSGTKV